MSRPASHDLDHVAARVGFAGVAEPVHHLHDCIHRGVEADGIVGRGDVVVDGAGNADGRDPVVGKVCRAAERAVAAAGNDAVDVIFFAGSDGLRHALRRFEFKAAVGIKNGAASCDDVAKVGRGGKKLHIVVNESLVSLINAVNLDAAGERGSRRGADDGIHAGRVAAGGQDADSSEIFHMFFYPSFYKLAF